MPVSWRTRSGDEMVAGNGSKKATLPRGLCLLRLKRPLLDLEHTLHDPEMTGERA